MPTAPPLRLQNPDEYLALPAGSPEYSIDVVNPVDKTRQDRDRAVRGGKSGEIGASCACGY